MRDKGLARKLDVRAWVLWVAAFSAIAMVARNPLYSLALILIARLIAINCSPSDSPGTGLPVLRLGIVILIFSILFNALSVHVGDTVLFRLPPGIPWIGGPVTLEAAVYGAGSALLLLSLLAAFAAFNGVVPSSELVRLTPGALRDVGVVILIAVTYMPETRLQLQRIREAQAIRGHRIQGIRAWRPIVIPLLIGGLERAMGLAEAMVARGFGATADVRQPLRIQLGLVAGLLLALSGWVLTFWSQWLGWSLLGTGVLTIAVLLWLMGHRTLHTQYRPRRWTRSESVTVAGIALALFFAFVPLPFVDRTTLLYSPYPGLSLPGFDPVIGIALLGLSIPALAALPE